MKKGRKSNSERMKDNIAKMDDMTFTEDEEVEELEEESLDDELDFESHHNFTDEFLSDDYE